MNIDDAIKSVAEKVLVLRFGRDEDSVCLQCISINLNVVEKFISVIQLKL
uniref:Uncharacterized protein n=1 Tax=Cyprinus carpio carpio TaxID=630221 RepID=A0A9J7XV33_CYPCA